MANGVTRRTGYQSYASDSANKYIPEVWSRMMLRNFYETTAFMQMANTDYEGEIKAQGDKVLIRTTPEINIGDYLVGGADGTTPTVEGIVYQTPTSDNRELNIDQAKYWAFRLDDLDEVASDLPLMEKFAADAGERLKIAIDTDCLSYIVGKADSDNSGDAAGAISGNIDMGEDTATSTDALSITKDNATETIVDMNLILDEANIPDENRYVILPAWYCALLKKSDLKSADITGDGTGVIRSGVIGMVDRTKIIQSNLLPKGTTNTAGFYCFAGTSEAMTFAAQLTKTENLRIQDSFGDYMRGLSVYGREVVQPTALVEGFFSKG